MADQIKIHIPDTNDEYIKRLLDLNILSLTKEEVTKLQNEIRKAKKELGYWKKTTPKNEYQSDLEDLLI